MRIAMSLVALSQALLAGTLGGMWLRDRREPPGKRSTHVAHGVGALLALGICIAALALAIVT
jgi:hypothetical protein